MKQHCDNCNRDIECVEENDFVNHQAFCERES